MIFHRIIGVRSTMHVLGAVPLPHCSEDQPQMRNKLCAAQGRNARAVTASTERSADPDALL
jgi:hypothetical protein